MLSLEMLVQAFPQQLWLEIAPGQCEEIEAQVTEYTSDAARRRIVLNTLCGEAIADGLRGEPDFEGESISVESDSSTWEFVNGTVLKVGSTRLVLIPDESADTEALRVPWEWVDIPEWRADYYLAVQMNVESDECWLRVWGFASHGVVKEGRKDNVWRTYEVERARLIEDLNVLWLSREFNLLAQRESDAHSQISPAEAQRWLDALGKPTAYSPRLEIPFERWAALLADEKWRQDLYRKRLRKTTSPRTLNLKQWLQQAIDFVEEGWQGVEELLAPLEPSAVRSVEAPQKIATPEAIAPILDLLHPGRSERERTQAAGVLGNIGRGHPAVVEALAELLHGARDEETRWQAALSLGKLQPGHPLAGIKKARLVDLGLQLGEHPLALIVAIMPRAGERIGVWVQVQPASGQQQLPPHLQLNILSDGKILLSVESRADAGGRGRDKSIERRFSPPPGTQFQIEVVLGEARVREEFVA